MNTLYSMLKRRSSPDSRDVSTACNSIDSSISDSPPAGAPMKFIFPKVETKTAFRKSIISNYVEYVRAKVAKDQFEASNQVNSEETKDESKPKRSVSASRSEVQTPENNARVKSLRSASVDCKHETPKTLVTPKSAGRKSRRSAPTTPKTPANRGVNNSKIPLSRNSRRRRILEKSGELLENCSEIEASQKHVPILSDDEATENIRDTPKTERNRETDKPNLNDTFEIETKQPASETKLAGETSQTQFETHFKAKRSVRQASIRAELEDKLSKSIQKDCTEQRGEKQFAQKQSSLGENQSDRGETQSALEESNRSGKQTRAKLEKSSVLDESQTVGKRRTGSQERDEFGKNAKRGVTRTRTSTDEEITDDNQTDEVVDDVFEKLGDEKQGKSEKLTVINESGESVQNISSSNETAKNDDLDGENECLRNEDASSIREDTHGEVGDALREDETHASSYKTHDLNETGVLNNETSNDKSQGSRNKTPVSRKYEQASNNETRTSQNESRRGRNETRASSRDNTRGSRNETRASRNETRASRNETRVLSNETQGSRNETRASRNKTRASRNETQASRNETRASRNETRGSRNETPASRNESPASRNGTPASRNETRGSRNQTRVARSETRASRKEIRATSRNESHVSRNETLISDNETVASKDESRDARNEIRASKNGTRASRNGTRASRNGTRASRNETRVARNETRASRNETRVSRNETRVSRSETRAASKDGTRNLTPRVQTRASNNETLTSSNKTLVSGKKTRDTNNKTRGLSKENRALKIANQSLSNKNLALRNKNEINKEINISQDENEAASSENEAAQSENELSQDENEVSQGENEISQVSEDEISEDVFSENENAKSDNENRKKSENEVRETLRGENVGLKNENETLMDENQRLKDENERLKNERKTLMGETQVLAKVSEPEILEKRQLRPKKSNLKKKSILKQTSFRIDKRNENVADDNRGLIVENKCLTEENLCLKDENEVLKEINKSLKNPDVSKHGKNELQTKTSEETCLEGENERGASEKNIETIEKRVKEVVNVQSNLTIKRATSVTSSDEEFPEEREGRNKIGPSSRRIQDSTLQSERSQRKLVLQRKTLCEEFVPRVSSNVDRRKSKIQVKKRKTKLSKMRKLLLKLLESDDEVSDAGDIEKSSSIESPQTPKKIPIDLNEWSYDDSTENKSEGGRYRFILDADDEEQMKTSEENAEEKVKKSEEKVKGLRSYGNKKIVKVQKPLPFRLQLQRQLELQTQDKSSFLDGEVLFKSLDGKTSKRNTGHNLETCTSHDELQTSPRHHTAILETPKTNKTHPLVEASNSSRDVDTSKRAKKLDASKVLTEKSIKDLKISVAQNYISDETLKTGERVKSVGTREEEEEGAKSKENEEKSKTSMSSETEEKGSKTPESSNKIVSFLTASNNTLNVIDTSKLIKDIEEDLLKGDVPVQELSEGEPANRRSSRKRRNRNNCESLYMGSKKAAKAAETAKISKANETARSNVNKKNLHGALEVSLPMRKSKSLSSSSEDEENQPPKIISEAKKSVDLSYVGLNPVSQSTPIVKNILSAKEVSLKNKDRFQNRRRSRSLKQLQGIKDAEERKSRIAEMETESEASNEPPALNLDHVEMEEIPEGGNDAAGGNDVVEGGNDVADGGNDVEGGNEMVKEASEVLMPPPQPRKRGRPKKVNGEKVVTKSPKTGKRGRPKRIVEDDEGTKVVSSGPQDVNMKPVRRRGRPKMTERNAVIPMIEVSSVIGQNRNFLKEIQVQDDGVKTTSSGRRIKKPPATTFNTIFRSATIKSLKKSKIDESYRQGKEVKKRKQKYTALDEDAMQEVEELAESAAAMAAVSDALALTKRGAPVRIAPWEESSSPTGTSSGSDRIDTPSTVIQESSSSLEPFNNSLQLRARQRNTFHESRYQTDGRLDQTKVIFSTNTGPIIMKWFTREAEFREINEISYADMVKAAGCTAGFLKIKPQKQKALSFPKKHNMFYAVWKGTGLVEMHNRILEFQEGDVFVIPKGATYRIKNTHDIEDVMLTFFKQLLQQ